MSEWNCGICDKRHDSLPMDIAFGKPERFFEIPEPERNDRVWLSAEHNADLCVVDGTEFFIRSFLPIPVDGGSKEFRLGVWVLVDKEFFRKYIENKEEELMDHLFVAQLATEVPGYEDTCSLKADIKLLNLNDRPSVVLKESTHLLAEEQRKGIEMPRVHQIVQACLPDLF